MEKRIQIDVEQPEAYKAMYTLENYLQQTELSKKNIELIKIRASQINGCAFCIDMHTKDAIKHGEDDQRIFLLSAWHETDLFSEEEEIILKITEEVTLIHEKGLSTATYNKAINLFSPTIVSQIIMAVTIINAWNRIAISTNKPVGS